jgi:hypothetical protein
MVWPLDGSQGPSPFRGHGPWFVCEVRLSLLRGQNKLTKRKVIKEKKSFKRKEKRRMLKG